jgi:TatD DNase family protein
MIIDSHCHLHDPAFADLKETLRLSMAHDVWGAIAVGTDPETNAQTLEAAAAAPKAVWPCLGFHPDRSDLTDEDLARVEAQIAAHHSRIVGIGEIGLPWYSLEGAPDADALKARGREWV